MLLLMLMLTLLLLFTGGYHDDHEEEEFFGYGHAHKPGNQDNLFYFSIIVTFSLYSVFNEVSVDKSEIRIPFSPERDRNSFPLD